MTLGLLIVAAVGVRILSALVWLVVPRSRRLTVTEVGLILAGIGGLLWTLSGVDPLGASLSAIIVGLSAGGIGAVLRRG